MSDPGSDILVKYGTVSSIVSAVEKLVCELERDIELAESWKLLLHILCNAKESDVTLDCNRILRLCLCYMNHPGIRAHSLVVQILVLLIESRNTTEAEELQLFLRHLQSSIMSQVDANHHHSSGLLIDYEVATSVLSQLLPSLIKAGFTKGEQPSPNKLIQAMILSKNEKSIIRGLSLLQEPAVLKETSLHSIFQFIRTLFRSEDDVPGGNHPGLTALCIAADILFSDRTLLAEQEEWFLRYAQQFVSHPVALNRKRAQYLLKRYVDFAVPDKAELFNDYFLILETLEERQMHIISPVLARMELWQDRFILTSRPSLETSWLRSVYGRMLSHESGQVVKWSLHHICRLQLEFWPGFGSAQDQWLYGPFLTGLNNVTFYVRDRTDQLPALCEDLVHLLRKVAGLPEERSGFFLHLLKGMSAVPWNCVGLFHLAYALASVPPNTPLLNEEALRIILEFLRSALHTHHPLVRGAVQTLLLEMIINLTDLGAKASENLHWVALILATLPSRKCYVHLRASPLHDRLLMWFKQNFAPVQLGEELIHLLDLYFQTDGHADLTVPRSEQYSVDVVSVARFAVLIVDAVELDQKVVAKLESCLEPLHDCQTRLYADERTLSRRIRLWTALIEECGYDVNHKVGQVHVFPRTESVVGYCLYRIATSTEYSVLCEYLSVLDSVAKADKKAGGWLFRSSVRRIESDANRFLEKPTALQRFKSISLLLILDDEKATDALVQQMLEIKMHCCPPQRDDSMSDDAGQQVTWGSFMSHYFAQLWTLLERRLSRLNYKTAELVEEAVVALDFAGVEAIKSILRVLAVILPRIATSDSSLCRSCLEQCWTACYEYRRADHFWSLMELFARMAFSRELMEEPTTLRPLLFGRFLSEMREQGENVALLFNLAAERVIDVWTEQPDSFTLDQFSIRCIVDLLTFGLIHRKDEMVQFDTFSLVRSLGERCPTSQHVQSEDLADGKVRFQGLRFLLSLNPEKETDVTTALAILDALLAEDRVTSGSKTRYFASSHGHRFKHRLWTAMLILQNVLPVREAAVMEAALNGLIDDNPQPSVRFLQEWSVVRVLVKDPSLEHLLWKALDRAVEQRAGSMVSFLAIAGHTARCLARMPGRLESFAAQALPRIMPWAMAQQFTPRLYAIVVVEMVWKAIEEQSTSSSGVRSLMEQYSTVRRLLATAPEMPNTRKNAEKLAADFYLSVFDPLDHFTLETLCYQLPRLAHLVSEEWMPVSWFDSLSVIHGIPRRNPDGDRLAKFEPAEWIARAAGGAPAFMGVPDDPLAVGNVQKKITPWKQMLPDVNSLLADSVARKVTKSGSSDSGLIVIASLIDRVPNLGGLCRTCEVLGARAFVVSTLNVTEDKEFISLSVSAEKWINVIEVKPFHLMNYFSQLKLDGYSIVGAEQTASSKPLNQFNFPRKTALLLGHEKEGIPVDLIQHLDYCVEVPQEGIIRSMNVHVTGAIFIWEYVRQQLGFTPTQVELESSSPKL